MDVTLIGDQITKFRKAQNLTQEELGRAVGVSTQAVSRWENGGAPDVSLLPAIADKLGVTVDALFGREDGEVRDMTGTLTGWLRSKPEEERMQALSRLIWETSFRAMTDIQVPEVDYPRSGEQVFSGSRAIMRTAVATDAGYMLGVAGEDMSYMCVFPEPKAGYARYLTDNDSYRKLFSALAMPAAMELLLFFSGERQNYYVIPSVAAKRIGCPLSDTEQALKALRDANILYEVELELEEGTIPAYMIVDINAVVPLLSFARWICQEGGLYFINMGMRERPCLKAKESGSHEKN